ncbi:hypothetical protein DFH27DRAFT_534152 [Peziza echinospora]|nr:hypothetical protein DFH27DRAFT_534152 [Peziza echinospora]
MRGKGAFWFLRLVAANGMRSYRGLGVKPERSISQRKRLGFGACGKSVIGLRISVKGFVSVAEDQNSLSEIRYSTRTTATAITVTKELHTSKDPGHHADSRTVGLVAKSDPYLNPERAPSPISSRLVSGNWHIAASG